MRVCIQQCISAVAQSYVRCSSLAPDCTYAAVSSSSTCQTPNNAARTHTVQVLNLAQRVVREQLISRVLPNHQVSKQNVQVDAHLSSIRFCGIRNNPLCSCLPPSMHILPPPPRLNYRSRRPSQALTRRTRGLKFWKRCPLIIFVAPNRRDARSGTG